MPNRILKEGICTSETIDQLTPFQETFFYRLIVNCDDFGRFDARPVVLKSRLFPLKDDLRLSLVEEALQKLCSLGTIMRYDVNGKSFLQIEAWDGHQCVRARKSKYPNPPQDAAHVEAAESNCTQLHANEINCKQMQADEINCKQLFPYSESYSYSESESKTEYMRKGAPADGAALRPTAIELPLPGKDVYAVTEDAVAQWQPLYPAVDVMQELRKMAGWLLANPTRRKTRRGIQRFIAAWLSRAQDQGHTQQQKAPARQMTAEMYRGETSVEEWGGSL